MTLMSKAALVTLDFEEAVAQIDIQIGLMEAKSDAEIFVDELRTLRQGGWRPPPNDHKHWTMCA